MVVDLSHLDVRFKVFHPEFDPARSYRALAYLAFGETAWGQIVFINERGMLYAVLNYKCRCVNPESFSSPQSDEIKALTPAKPKGRNPAIDEMDT